MPNGNNDKKKILVLSYFAGQQGFSPAEWLDDKVDALTKLGHDVILISCLSSKKNINPQVRHYRVPSISLNDFKLEYNELKSTKQTIPLYMYLLFPMAYTLGFIFDRLFILATKGLGGGKLSWSITSFASALYTLSTNQIDIILSTGGAASSHISAALAGLISRTPVVIELQDPLAGHGIGRTSKSAQLLLMLEKFLLKTSKKVVYVTQQAAQEARERWGRDNAVCIYPGSRDFNIVNVDTPKNKFRFLHLGTLYSTRNFDTLVQALDKLIATNKLSADEIELVNLGDVYGECLNIYKTKSYFKQYPIRPRAEAIAYAAQSDVNLIVQHTDPRSTTTIPYKTYDYFNLNRQILGLTNNKELSNMLVNYGYQAANITQVDEIAETVLKLVRNEFKFTSSTKKLHISQQVTELIS